MSTDSACHNCHHARSYVMHTVSLYLMAVNVDPIVSAGYNLSWTPCMRRPHMPTVNNCPQMNTTEHKCIQLYTTEHSSTQLSTTLSNWTQLCITLYNCTKLYTTVHNSIQLYKTPHDGTQLYTTVNNCTTDGSWWNLLYSWTQWHAPRWSFSIFIYLKTKG